MGNLVAPNIEQLIAEWEKDARVDTTNAGGEMINIPILHSKYSKYLSMHKLAKAKREQELASLRKLKWMHINGKLSQEELQELGWEPYVLTILKPDQPMVLDADPAIQKINAQITFHEECVSFCVYVMKELNNRTWQMKEWMAWERFDGGHGK